jgi:hypothetical protein
MVEQEHLSAIRDSVELDSTTSEEILQELVKQGYTILEALESITQQLKIMNLHLSLMTDEIIEEKEVE